MQADFPLNIHSLRIIYQAASSYWPQVMHSERILAKIGNPAISQEEIDT
jgi:hypothetical protein